MLFYYLPITSITNLPFIHECCITGIVFWAIDPGRTNIIYAMGFDAHGRLIKTRILTRAQYYNESKINACVKRSHRWNNSMKVLNQGLSDNHFKTMNIDSFTQAVDYYNNNFDELWVKKGVSKKWSRQNLFLYGEKKRVLHQFLNTLEGVNPTVYYGSGTFAAGQLGERYAPCKYVKKECQMFFHCVIVNEFRTSQVCPRCHNRLFKVMKHHNGKRKEVRGLK